MVMTDKQKQFLAMWKAGITFRAMSVELGISVRQLQNWRKAAKLPHRGQKLKKLSW
jgi:hypothetical protein